jgi:hypothetical protein
MADPMLYQEDWYVFLLPDAGEEFLSPEETLAKLEQLVDDLGGALPADLARLETNAARAQYLLDTACELELSPGRSAQWYAVRLEK